MHTLRPLIVLSTTAVLLAGGLPAPLAAAHAHNTNRDTSKPPIKGAPEGWATWAPREEIAPRFYVNHDSKVGTPSLGIQSNSELAVGAWRRKIEGIEGGKTYRFTVNFKATGVSDPRRQLSARVTWLDDRGQAARPPDYAIDTCVRAKPNRMEHVCEAPDNARAALVDLQLAWTPPGGSVVWSEPKLVAQTATPHRIVRAVAINHRPRDTASAAASVEEFCRVASGCAARKPDLICLPEGITVVGTGKSYAEVAELVPGPTTRRLGDLARELRSYVVAGLYERVGTAVYNTAVLLDRGGKLVGSYRKTHLPREEVDGGITPGNTYPVFDTDFGKVGLIICWDVQFPEPARAMALKGAEVLVLPIWGGSEILTRARAQENHVFLLASSYDMKTMIVDPKGDIQAEATGKAQVAFAELDLDRKIVQPWLGDMKVRTWKERRPDIPVQP